MNTQTETEIKQQFTNHINSKFSLILELLSAVSENCRQVENQDCSPVKVQHRQTTKWCLTKLQIAGDQFSRYSECVLKP